MLLCAVALLGLLALGSVDARAESMAPHSCVVKEDATVWCWGSNFGGALGNSSLTARESAVPVQVTGITDAVKVSTGLGGSCAIRGNGHAYCWGANDVGQLGNPGVGSGGSVTPVEVSGLTGVVDISIGYYTACAVTGSGALYCWGMGSATPAQVATGARSVSAGVGHYCAVFDDDTVECGGLNFSGALGNGTKSEDPTPLGPVAGLSGVRSVSASYFHTCAVLNSGGVKCWGGDFNGISLLGSGQAGGSLVPVDVVGISTATEVAASAYGTCARLAGGTVKCWGLIDVDFASGFEDAIGQMHTVPVLRAGLTDVTGLLAGSFLNSCAVRANKTVVCWGVNSEGSLGNGQGSQELQPAGPVEGISGAKDLSVGRQHICVIRSDDTIACWGSNSRGQLGVSPNDLSNAWSPRVVATGGHFNKVSAGHDHTCAVKSDGTVWCWGDSYYGKLANGLSDNTYGPPSEVAGLSDAVDVSVGERTSCAITATDDVWCWGVIPGDGTVRTAPVHVYDGTDVGPVAMSDRNLCLVDAGVVKCWGENSYGQLGDGTTDSVSLNDPPAEAQGLTGVTALALGTYYACAANSTATYCWGYADGGLLGNGGPESHVPAQVGPPSIVAKGLAASNSWGREHVCAAATSGSAYCWGEGESGELGNGAGTDSGLPVAVAGLSTVAEVGSGESFSCALLDGGTVRCWGQATGGQLGTGAGRLGSWTPTAVLGLSGVKSGDLDDAPDEPEPDPDTGTGDPGVVVPIPLSPEKISETLPPVPTSKPVATLRLNGRYLVFAKYALQANGKKGKGCPAKVKVSVKIAGVKKQFSANVKSKKASTRCLVTAKLKLPAKAGKVKQVTVKFSGTRVVKRTVTAKRDLP